MVYKRRQISIDICNGEGYVQNGQYNCEETWGTWDTAVQGSDCLVCKGNTNKISY